MGTSILIAKLAAALYLSAGIALLNKNLNLQESYKALEKSRMLTSYLGMVAIMLGTLITTYHNLWTGGWPILITLIGWALLVEGALYILVPKSLLNIFRKLPKNQMGW